MEYDKTLKTFSLTGSPNLIHYIYSVEYDINHNKDWNIGTLPTLEAFWIFCKSIQSNHFNYFFILGIKHIDHNIKLFPMATVGFLHTYTDRLLNSLYKLYGLDENDEKNAPTCSECGRKQFSPLATIWTRLVSFYESCVQYKHQVPFNYTDLKVITTLNNYRNNYSPFHATSILTYSSDLYVLANDLFPLIKKLATHHNALVDEKDGKYEDLPKLRRVTPDDMK